MMFETLTLFDLGIFASIALFAGIVHGAIGLGFPLLSTAILSTFVDLRMAILITLLPTVTVNLISIARGGNWSLSLGRYWPLAVWCLIGSVIGAYVIVLYDPTPYKLLLALLIFLYLILERVKHEILGCVRRYPATSNLGFGLVAGFSAGSTNTMVPILIIYALEVGWAKTVMVQVFNMCFLSGKAAQLAVFHRGRNLQSQHCAIYTAFGGCGGDWIVFWKFHSRQDQLGTVPQDHQGDSTIARIDSVGSGDQCVSMKLCGQYLTRIFSSKTI